MKKPILIRILVVLLGASLLAACGQTALPSANPGSPAVSEPTTAPLATLATANQSTPTVAPLAPLATATSKSSSTGFQDACVLITKDDVSKVLGQTFEPVAGQVLKSSCAYKFQLSRFDLAITHTEGTTFMQTTRTKLAEMALDIPGLGDEALYNVNSSTLFVRKGEAVYLLSYLDSMVTQDDKIGKEKALAGLLLSRLN